MKYLPGIFLLLITSVAFAQKQERPLIQFSGIVHNADSVKVIVPFVTVTNISNHNQVNLADYQGYFSFVAHENDTLRFTSIGYAPQTVVIPETSHHSYITQVMLKPAIINLPAFRVFPWATTDEFRKDFLSLKLADDDLEIARKNIQRSTSKALYNTLPRDGQEIQAANAQAEHYNLVNSHSITNPLLNPIAWGTLIKQIADGDKSRASDANNSSN